MTDTVNIPRAEDQLPRWYKEDILIPFKAGIASVFIIHGDTNCFVPNPDVEEENSSYITLRQFFEKTCDELEIVIFYNIASGIRFLKPEMEKEFKKIAGIETEESDSRNPVASAKASLASKRGLPRDPETCLPLIEKVLKSSEGVAVIINSVHFLAPSSTTGGALPQSERINIERLKNWAQDDEIKTKRNIVLLLTDQTAKVSQELRQTENEIHTLFIPKPSKEERAQFISVITQGTPARRKLLEENAKLEKKIKKTGEGTSDKKRLEEEFEEQKNRISSFPKLFPVSEDFDTTSFAHVTQGMSLRQIREIFLHCQKTGTPIDLFQVKLKKKEILNNEYGEVMEIVEPERGLEDIGGLEYIKEYLQNILNAIRCGETRLVPMGVTLMGPPGTGKTAIVEALAKEAGFNFVKTKSIRSMWVGESEARMEKLLYGLRSLAPVIVMNDEADLAEARRDSPKGDSGVSERLMKMWMELLSDPRIRGQIIVISCTNRPDRIDPALKRSGRSDERILVPMPSFQELVAIFKVMFRRHKIPVTIDDFTPYAAMVDGLSGADVEKITLDSYRFAVMQNKRAVDNESLREAIQDAIPSASQADIDLMTLCAIMESSSRRLLPPNVNEMLEKIQKRRLVENIDEIFSQIKARNIIKEENNSSTETSQNTL